MRDGIHCERIAGLSKEDILAKEGIEIHSVEGSQLLRHLSTDKPHFHVSIDTGTDVAWRSLEWEAMLFMAEELAGPWESKGIILPNDQDCDARQAKDSTIDIVDG